MKLPPRKLIIIAAAALAAALIAGVAFLGAGGIGDKQAAQQQAVYDIHDEATFKKRTKSYSMMPYGKADLEFEIYLPSDWTPEDMVTSGASDVNAKIAGPVAQFRSPMIGTQFVKVTIEVLKLDTEISSRNWLKNYLLSSGYLPQGDVTEINNRSASGAYISSTEGSSKFCYIAARISGSYAVTARFEAPLNLRGYIAYIQKKSIDSFKLLYPKDDPIEEAKTYTLVDSVKFNYPGSWTVSNPDFRDMNRLILELRNNRAGTEGKYAITDGYIRILAIRRQRATDLETEIDAIRKYFNETMSIEFKKMVSTGKSDAYARFIFNRYEVYDVVSKAAKIPTTQEIHLVVLGDKEWYIFAYLFTPKEINDLATWARNVQSFQEVVKSVK